MAQQKPRITQIRPLQREPEQSTEGDLLSPAQKHAYQGLMHALAIGNVLVCWGGAGKGKTTILRAIHALTGGAFLTMKDVIDSLQDQNPLAVEETFERLMMQALYTND